MYKIRLDPTSLSTERINRKTELGYLPAPVKLLSFQGALWYSHITFIVRLKVADLKGLIWFNCIRALLLVIMLYSIFHLLSTYSTFTLQGGPKIGTISLYALTLPNIKRFSKVFHCQNQKKNCNNLVTKDTTTSQVCRYTALWNVKYVSQKQQLTTRRLLQQHILRN